MWPWLLIGGGLLLAHAASKKKAPDVPDVVQVSPTINFSSDRKSVTLPYLAPGVSMMVGPVKLTGLGDGSVRVLNTLVGNSWVSPPDRVLPIAPPPGASKDSGNWVYQGGKWIWDHKSEIGKAIAFIAALF